MVLDTSAFVGGFDPFTIREDQVAPPTVEEEVKRNSMTLLRFSAAVESGRLKIFAPAQKFLDAVKVFSNFFGRLVFPFGNRHAGSCFGFGN